MIWSTEEKKKILHNTDTQFYNHEIKLEQMKNLLTFFATFLSISASFAQLDLPPGGNNPRATISEEVGITSITIKYSRPDVNKREGKIWGDGNLITYGFSTQNFITNTNISPWRAGANENTVITFEHDIKVEGQPLKAGTYSIHMAMGADNVTIIFNSKIEAWGSFYYEEKYDLLRINVKPVALDKSVEYLKYEFIEHKEKYCVIAMQWEKLSVPFKVDVDVDNIVVARVREELTNRKGFTPALLLQATQFCFNKNINLQEALDWSKRAIDGVGGQKTYITLRNLATAYEKLNRLPEADSTMKEALTIATANQYTAYGRQLITQKRADKAMEVFTASKKRYGDILGVNNGLMSGYSAKGDFKNAVKFAEKAIVQAPNEAVKKQIEGFIVKLKEGKDINQ
jgi:tetratricopeptide (TPR) repeat protein